MAAPLAKTYCRVVLGDFDRPKFTEHYELSFTLPMLLTKIARGMRSVNFSIC